MNQDRSVMQPCEHELTNAKDIGMEIDRNTLCQDFARRGPFSLAYAA